MVRKEKTQIFSARTVFTQLATIRSTPSHNVPPIAIGNYTDKFMLGKLWRRAMSFFCLCKGDIQKILSLLVADPFPILRHRLKLLGKVVKNLAGTRVQEQML